MKICRLSLPLVAALAFCPPPQSYAGGLLTNTRYEDDFDGGPILSGWLQLGGYDGDQSLNLYNGGEVTVPTGDYYWEWDEEGDPVPVSYWRPCEENNYCGYTSMSGVYGIQMPHIPAGLSINSDALISVSFDYDDSSSGPEIEDLVLEFSTVRDGLEWHQSMAMRARQYLNSNRVFANIPFASIPREDSNLGDEAQFDLAFRVRSSGKDSWYGSYYDSIALDNFAFDWQSAPSNALSWSLNDPVADGWTTSGFAGQWATSRYVGQFPSGHYQVFDGIAAVHDGTYPYNDGNGSPSLRVDAWTPEFRFADLAQAVLTFDFGAYLPAQVEAGNDQVLIDIYQTSAPGVPSTNAPALARLFTFDLASLGYGYYEAVGQSGTLAINVLQKAFNGEIPENHVDNETVYRIRTRVFDNDVNLNSFDRVEIDDFSITHAVLNLRGDYDKNGVVDGRDFLVWQRTFGQTTSLAADGNGSGMVDVGDLAIWQSHFGQALATGNLQTFGILTSPIPEPASVFACAVWFGMLFVRRLRGLRL